MLKTKQLWEKLVLIAGLSLGLSLTFPVLVFLAQAETFCPPGQTPQFQLGFAQLKNKLGAEMGEPVECEHYDAQGNAYQQTTTGLAFFEKIGGDFTFTAVPQPLAMGALQEVTPTVEMTSSQEITSTEETTSSQEATSTPEVTSSQEVTPTEEMTSSQEITTAPGVTVAMAEMQNISGTVVGTAQFTETAEGLQVSVVISGLTEAEPGAHGIHFHQVGRCLPDFAVAGEHFNPTMTKHGLENPMGPHVGDLPNIEFDENGGASYNATAMLSLGTGENALLAADGTALIIHAMTDDQMSDPSGLSGRRIACGVLTAVDVPPPAEPEPAPPVQGSNVEPERRSPTSERRAQLQAPDGFVVSIFAEDLGNVRMMAQAEDGTVYVTRPKQGDVLALRNVHADGVADEMMVAASNLESVHGIAIEGEQIYLATPTTIFVGSLAPDGTVENLTALVTNLPEAGQHGNRTMAFGPDGRLYVSVGSPCNACSIVNEEYAAILQVQPDGSSRTLFAEGLRNTIGWGWHPETGQMWGMDHGSDWRGDDQPPEELNLLAQGNNYGWPYCFADRQIDPYMPGQPMAMTKAEFCAQSTGPVLTYQAHAAPIGMVFYTGQQFPEEYRNDAFIAMRGSWNRQEPVGYKIVHLDFDEAGQPVAFNDFVTGWLIEDGAAQFGRVAGLLGVQEGSLLVSDDTNGVIYRVSYIGER